MIFNFLEKLYAIWDRLLREKLVTPRDGELFAQIGATFWDRAKEPDYGEALSIVSGYYQKKEF